MTFLQTFYTCLPFLALASLSVFGLWAILKLKKAFWHKLSKTGFEHFATYTIDPGGENVNVRLYRVKREYRGLVDEKVISQWLEAIGEAYPEKSDAEDTFFVPGLPSSFSIQFVMDNGEVAVLDIGYPSYSNPLRKQVTMRRQKDLAFGEYDLIAAIDKQLSLKKKPRDLFASPIAL